MNPLNWPTWAQLLACLGIAFLIAFCLTVLAGWGVPNG